MTPTTSTNLVAKADQMIRSAAVGVWPFHVDDLESANALLQLLATTTAAFVGEHEGDPHHAQLAAIAATEAVVEGRHADVLAVLPTSATGARAVAVAAAHLLAHHLSTTHPTHEVDVLAAYRRGALAQHHREDTQ